MIPTTLLLVAAPMASKPSQGRGAITIHYAERDSSVRPVTPALQLHLGGGKVRPNEREGRSGKERAEDEVALSQSSLEATAVTFTNFPTLI